MGLRTVNQEISNAITLASAKTAPPVAAWLWTGDHLIGALTGAFIVLQIAYLIWRWKHDWRERKRREQCARGEQTT